MADFADEASAQLREAIDSKVGDDHDYFTIDFLEKVLAWMRAGTFSGPELDWYRVVLLQSFLEGDAHRWYVSETSSYAKENDGDSPAFADVICAMHRRFVKSSTAQRATRAFDAIKWDPAAGPEQLYSELLDKGRRMIRTPDEFVMRKRFLSLLPRWVYRELRLRRGITAEFTPIETMRTHARQVWEVEAGMKDEEALWPDAPQFKERRLLTKSDTRNKPLRRGDPTPRERPATDRERVPRTAPRPPRENDTRPSSTRNPRDGDTKVCFSCGGNHFARDKSCPNYGKHNSPRELARVAAQRVVESYSDEETQSESSNAYDSERSETEDDRNEAPDLEELLAASNEEDVRVNAMRGRTVRYFSMRIIESHGEEEDQSAVSDTESSITAPSLEENIENIETDESAPFGSYNDGPICVVCNDCALVHRLIPATPQNGLIFDRPYTVCAHLAYIGISPEHIAAPESPRPSTPSSLPDAEGRQGSFEGMPTNWLGEPDFEVGIIVDIESPPPIEARCALDEVCAHDRVRINAGLRPLTALEHHANVRWLTRYRRYTSIETDKALEEYESLAREQRLSHPELGPEARGQEMLEELDLARRDEERIALQGPGTRYELEPVQTIVLQQLGRGADAHKHNLVLQNRKAQAIVTRRLMLTCKDRMITINRELDNPSLEGEAEELWERARVTNAALYRRLGWEMDELRTEQEQALLYRDWARTRESIQAFTSPRVDARRDDNSGTKGLDALPPDEAELWERSTAFSVEDLEAMTRTPPPVTVSQRNTVPGPSDSLPETIRLRIQADADEYDAQTNGYTYEEEIRRITEASRWNEPRSWQYPEEASETPRPSPFESLHASRTIAEDNSSTGLEDTGGITGEPPVTHEVSICVRESYDSTKESKPPRSIISRDELVLRSVRMRGNRDAEQITTWVDEHGSIYYKVTDLPDDHYLNPRFRPIHEAALDDAIDDREDYEIRSHVYSQATYIMNDSRRSTQATTRPTRYQDFGNSF
ncbi:hypothetical protein B0H15DRAFT_801694 [Mycena belliarum]|uniref:Uncharacterized protein n=1 Tax=Mycena belliarum TaxID=1033014 RepID=A0AAD6U130_9AGAR|nr:hypothetical protein B0H15DRAFT_801694 [Mycena belliae]